VEVALVEQGLRGLRTRLLAYQPVDACLCRASQIAVALREVYVLEGVVAVLIAGGTVRVGLRDAAVQGGLTVVGTGGTWTKARGPVGGILIQPVDPELPRVVQETAA